MIAAIITAGLIMSLLLMCALARAAGNADERLNELYQESLLREESMDGKGSEKNSQAV